MPGKRGHDQPLSIDDAKRFVEAYVTERDIESVGDQHSALKACRDRAEIARDSYKSLNPAGISKPSSRAEKYERRLHNNRKSAAAMRVFHEVENIEQKHMLSVACSKLERARKKEAKVKKTLEALRAEVSRLTNGEVTEEPVADGEQNVEHVESAELAMSADINADDVATALNSPMETMAGSPPAFVSEPLLRLPPFATLGLPESGFIDGINATDEIPLHHFSFSQGENIFGVKSGGDHNNNPA